MDLYTRVGGQGRIQDLREGGAYAQLLKVFTARKARANFFATSPTNCACASSTWLLLLVGVVDVGCPAQFNISANVQRWMAGDGDHDHGDGAIRARSKLASS